MKPIKFLPLVGLALFIGIIWNLDLSRVLQQLSSVDPALIAMALGIHIPVILFKSYKWKVLVKAFSFDLPLRKAVSAWMVGFSVGILTPGRMGDMIRAYYIKDRISTGKSLITVITDRLIDIYVLFIISIVGLFTFFSVVASSPGTSMALFLAGLLAALVFATAMATRRELVIRLALPFHRRLVPEKLKPRLKKTFNEVYEGIGILKSEKRLLSVSVVFDVLAWGLVIVIHYILLLSLGIDIPLILVASFIPLVILLDALPISFSGVGTRDAAMIFFLGMLSISAETAVSFSILILIFNYLAVALVGYVSWIRNPIQINLR